jgi:phosphoribosylformylglycinamidine synthase PurS subunit
MYYASVYVTPKEGILDPQGATIERALPALGFEGVGTIRVGRYITLEVDGSDEEVVRKDVEAMCRNLLANPIIEDYRFELRGGPLSAGSGEEDLLVSEDTPVHTAGEHAASPWTAVDPYATREEPVE